MSTKPSVSYTKNFRTDALVSVLGADGNDPKFKFTDTIIRALLLFDATTVLQIIPSVNQILKKDFKTQFTVTTTDDKSSLRYAHMTKTLEKKSEDAEFESALKTFLEEVALPEEFVRANLPVFDAAIRKIVERSRNQQEVGTVVLTHFPDGKLFLTLTTTNTPEEVWEHLQSIQ